MAVKIFDLELSNVRFALRLLWGLILGGLVLFLFYYLPAHLGTLISPFVPSQYAGQINSLASELDVGYALGLLGVLYAIFVFFGTLFKGSWGYGIVLILTGLYLLIFYYFLFQAGSILPTFPSIFDSVGNLSYLTIALYILVALILISAVIDVGRGIALIARRGKRNSNKTF